MAVSSDKLMLLISNLLTGKTWLPECRHGNQMQMNPMAWQHNP